MPSAIPPLRDAIHRLLPIRNHPTQISFTFDVQPFMPLVSSVSDNPVVLLLQNPREIRPVVVSVERRISDEAVDQDRRFAILECEGRVVDVQVLWQRVVCSAEAESSRQNVFETYKWDRCEAYKVMFAVFG